MSKMSPSEAGKKGWLKSKQLREANYLNRNTEWMGKPIPLVLDHINGDPENHSLGNVRLVCGNCNMFLPTFCGRNKGKGRRNRK